MVDQYRRDSITGGMFLNGNARFIPSPLMV